MIKVKTSQSGMTLVEMVIVVGLFGLLTTMIFGAAQFFYQTNGYTVAQASEIDHARRGVTTLTRDLREMTYSENGSYPVNEMEEHLVGFYSDIDKDSNVEYVRYELDAGGTDFYKRVYNPAGNNPPTYDLTSPDEEILMSEYVQNRDQSLSTFIYYDSNNNVVSSAQLADVRYIEAQIIVNIDPIRSPGEFILRTAVAPRNLKDNL